MRRTDHGRAGRRTCGAGRGGPSGCEADDAGRAAFVLRQPSDEDALDLAWFVVEVVALEATLGRIVARHGNRSADKVEKATLGTLIGWAKPILVKHGVEAEVFDQLREVNQLRISVVHRLPSVLTAWGGKHIWTYVDDDGEEVRVSDLHPYGTMAWLIRERLSQLAVG